MVQLEIADGAIVAKSLVLPPQQPTANLTRNAVLSLDNRDPAPAVIAMKAGTGFGKTTLLRQLYTRRTDESRCLWVTLPDQSISSDVLFAYLQTALGTLNERLFSRYTENGDHIGNTWTTIVANILLDQKCGLCLDLAGCSLDGESNRVLDRLLALATADSPIYIAGRPAWKSAQLQVRATAGDALIVPVADLLYSAGEVRDYLARFDSLLVDEELVANVYENTLGWPMAVTLIADNLARAGVSRLSRVRQQVRRQLTEWLEEHLTSLSAHTVSTIRSLLIIDEFDEEILARVTLSRRAAQTLDRLLFSDLPIIYKVGTQSWSFPPIVRDALVKSLDVRRHGRRWREALAEMARIYRGRGRLIDAADSWLAADETLQAAEALASVARETLSKRRPDTLAAVAARLNDGLIAREPILGVYRAIASGANLMPQQDTAAHYERASKLINEAGQAEDISVLVPRWADYLTAAGQIQPADEAISRLLVRASSHPYIRARLTLSQARINLLQGKLDEASKGIDGALSTGKARLEVSESGRASEWRNLGSILGGHPADRSVTGSPDSVQRRSPWLAPLVDWLGGNWRAFDAARLPTATIEPGLERSALWLKYEQSGRAGHPIDGHEARRNAQRLENAGDLVTAALTWAAIFRARARGQLNMRPSVNHLNRLIHLIDIPLVKALCRLSMAAHHLAENEQEKARSSVRAASSDIKGTDCRALAAATDTLHMSVGGPEPAPGAVATTVNSLSGLLWSLGPMTVISLGRALESDLAANDIRRLLRRQPALARQFRRVRSLSTSDESQRLDALIADQSGGDDKGRLTPGEESAPVYIRTFGSFSLEVNGVALKPSDWRSAKTKQILALLLLRRGRGIPRDELINMIWPGTERESGSNNLKFCWSILKRLLEPGLTNRAESRFLRRGPAGYELIMDDGLKVDVDVFGEQLVRCRWSGSPDDLLGAVNLYRGDFLADLPATDDIESKRDRYRAEYISAVMRIVNYFGERGRLAEAKSLATQAQRVLTGRPELEDIEDRLARWEQGI